MVKDDDELILVQSNTGQLWRVTFGGHHHGDDDHGDDDHHDDNAAPSTPKVEEIALKGGPVTGGDGLLLDRGRLLVVRGSTPDHPNGAIDTVKLRHHRTRGEVVSEFSDPSFTGPSTIARARHLLLVVNPNFNGAAAATQFTVSGIDRDSVRGNGGGHGGHGNGDRHGGGDDHGGGESNGGGHGHG